MESFESLVVAPIERDIVLVEGSDARSYLQTQLTQDVMSIGLGHSSWSFILSPDSSIEGFVRVTRIGHDRLTLDTEPGYGDAVRERLDGLLFRTDARFTQMTWPGLAWRGTRAHGAAVDAPIASRVPFAGIEALDIVGPGVQIPDGAPVVDSEACERWRVAGAWPAISTDLGEGISPAMTGLVDLTVSFEKGCYTGQELVARTYHRGAAPTKRLVRLRFDGEVQAGDVLRVGGDEAGLVSSVAGDIGLGYLARKFEAPTEAVTDGASVSVSSVGDRFSAAL